MTYLSFVIPNVVNMNVTRNSFFTADLGVARIYVENYIFCGSVFRYSRKKGKSIYALIFLRSICLMNREKVCIVVVLFLYVWYKGGSWTYKNIWTRSYKRKIFATIFMHFVRSVCLNYYLFIIRTLNKKNIITIGQKY